METEKSCCLWQQEQGFDVIDVKEELWHGTEDKRLMEVAYKEKQFIIAQDVDNATIVIVAIAHLHRKPRYWTDRLMNK